MKLKNTDHSYGLITKLLHWVIGLLVLTEFGIIFYKENFLPDQSPLGGTLIGGFHKPIGFCLLVLGCLALVWHIINIKPAYPTSMSSLEKKAAKIVQILMYLSIIVMASAGLAMSVASGYGVNVFGLFAIPGLETANKELANNLYEVHEVTGTIILTLIAIHIAAIIKHKFFDKDNIVKRML